MNNIHGLSDVDYAAFEADMFGFAAEAAQAEIVEIPEDDVREGWRELEVWIDESQPGRRAVDVILDGVLLYWAIYYEACGGWHEANYQDGAGAPARTLVYEAGGWTKGIGWRWNEFTDEWVAPEWALS